MRRRLTKWFLRGLAGLIALVAVGLAGGWVWLRGSLPQTSGEIAIEGLLRPVEVLRDADGLVTLRAGSEIDAHRALGFVHAQ